MLIQKKEEEEEYVSFFRVNNINLIELSFSYINIKLLK